jgi:hypothetical protein
MTSVSKNGKMKQHKYMKSSWTGGSAPLFLKGLQNSGAQPPVHGLFKRPS